MENKNKNQAVIEFIIMIENSWTYERLTKDERERLKEAITSSDMQGLFTGTYQQRWKQLQALYRAFLLALDYRPIGWRE